MDTTNPFDSYLAKHEGVLENQPTSDDVSYDNVFDTYLENIVNHLPDQDVSPIYMNNQTKYKRMLSKHIMIYFQILLLVILGMK